jgi:type I restriction enzyme R subunit
MQTNPDSEQALENATVELFASLGYATLNAEYETFGPDGTLGRESRDEVVLQSRLRPALEALNPGLPLEALELAIQEILLDRSLMTPENANREVYKLLRNGVRVKYRDEYGEDVDTTVSVIDWNNPYNNDFLLVQQLWVYGGLYTKRPDLVGFVNGIPLVFIELKTSHRNIKHAYNGNLRDYRDTIPRIFWYNALIILSNGRDARIGSISAEWEHFSDWKKISRESEEGRISLETLIQGTCEPSRLLDLVESFILFSEGRGKLVKLLAKNHQYLGVNNAVEAVLKIRDNQGRLGVFWHTQGSGKSYSMVFFSQKILRKLPGNWTFVVVSDAIDLDDQIYKNFANTSVITEPEDTVRASTGEQLKQLLREDHRYVFTLVEKFHTRDGNLYPLLSERDDIIVITDESHRSQYGSFAANMRRALPNAAFIAFTGTPLIAGEREKTRDVFGDYVSIYNFKQSVDDHATVPLYYENRIPQLELTNETLNDDIVEASDRARLDENQELALEQEFAREYHLITREDRLERIAEDIVEHYMVRGYEGREYNGKAMVVSIDRFTAVRMYEKVHTHWQQYIERLQAEHQGSLGDQEREALAQKLAFMQETDMAVVISSSQNEVADFKDRGINIIPYRRRIENEDLDIDFKDPAHPFRIVFVCAMWMTGFDVPTCATIYLDKPMRNHTLMQTIARANRVYGAKQNGLIIDYIGIFRNLEKALAIYGAASGGGIQEGDQPVHAKHALLAQLAQVIDDALAFCEGLGIDILAIENATGYDREKLKYEAYNVIESILESDEKRERFLLLVQDINRLYKSCLPHPNAPEYDPTRRVLNVIAQYLLDEISDVDISEAAGEVEEILDESIVTANYVIRDAPTEHLYDLSQIDFEALKARFESGHKRLTVEKLRGAISRKLRQMVRQNRSRMDFQEVFNRMIADYNSGATGIDQTFSQLIDLVGSLSTEEQRNIAENLTEEELAIFDLLTRPDMTLTRDERERVKMAARELLDSLKREKLVLDWRKRQQTQAAVRISIRDVLDHHLPQSYDDMFNLKVEAVYQHIYESYFGAGQSIYGPAA